MFAPPLIAAAHGTTSEAGLRSIRALLSLVAKQRPGLDISLCFLDVLQPDLETTLRRQPDGIVVPVLLSRGYHVLTDIPGIVSEFPLSSVATHLGPDRGLSHAIRDRLSQVEADQPDGGHSSATIALVAGGSRAPEAAVDLSEAAADLAAVTGRHVEAFTVTDELTAGLRGLSEPIVATYLLAEGYFFSRLNALAAGVARVTPVIGAHPEVAALILRRYDVEVSARL